MSKKKKQLLAFDLLFMILLIVLDQVTKGLAILKLKDRPSVPVIPGVLELNYLENRGAAFGMLQNQKVLFIMVALIILSVILYILFKTPDHKKYNLLHVLLIMIASGAVGNMIDRFRYNYVVDFIYFVLINFPIFNVADIYVTLATFFLVILLIFVYKEEDISFISFKSQKYREVK